MPSGAKLKLGDPLLGKWARKMKNRVRKMDERQLIEWLMVVRLYRIEEIERTVVAMARAMVRVPRRTNRVAGAVFDALPAVVTKRSRQHLLRMLQVKLPDNNRVWRNIGFQPAIAEALIRLDDDTGRDLLTSYYLQAMANSPLPRSGGRDIQVGVPGSGNPQATSSEKRLSRQEITSHIRRFCDPKMIVTLQDAAESDPNLQVPIRQITMSSLLLSMRIGGLPLDDVRALLTPGTPEEMAVRERLNPQARADAFREPALRVLAERGEVSDIKLLEKTRDAIDPDPKSRNRLAKVAHWSVVVIRCRLWRELGKK